MLNRDNRGGALSRRPQDTMGRPRTNDWLWQRDPWQEMQEMQRRVDHLFSRVFGQDWPAFSPQMGRMANWSSDWDVAEPDIDFSENETEYTIKAALPGISPNDIDVQATEDSIRLTAQTRWSEPQQQAQSGDGSGGAQNTSGTGGGQQSQGQTAQQSQGQTTQHRQGQFSRVNRFEFAYTLPEEIKPGEVNANFRNGILELRLPKARPVASRNRAVSIPIQGAEQNAQISAGVSGQQSAQTPSNMGRQESTAEHQSGGRSSEGDGTAQNTGQTAKLRSSAGAASAKSK